MQNTTSQTSNPILLKIRNLSKTYASGLVALHSVDLDIHRGEIFALLGPNGAGKSTLIHMVCGIVVRTMGEILLDGRDIDKDYRWCRSHIGLVPQEIATESFETVWNAVSFSRGLFGRSPNPALVERVLRSLHLWEKKDSMIRTLSGGMKRRLMIAKALSHEPSLLFLDEPTAGVDVQLRRDLWQMVRDLRASGVTIILTTHYIEEAEEMADRIGIIDRGRIILVEEKQALMKKLGKKELTLQLHKPLAALPADFAGRSLDLSKDGFQLTYHFDTQGEDAGIADLLRLLQQHGIQFKDLQTRQSSLQEIFVSLVGSHS
jgi:ABC-2 type transport system ATP-binding protein